MNLYGREVAEAMPAATLICCFYNPIPFLSLALPLLYLVVVLLVANLGAI